MGIYPKMNRDDELASGSVADIKQQFLQPTEVA
jgi:hypothetical protein